MIRSVIGDIQKLYGNETAAHKKASYKCEGCDGKYPTENYVVKHEIKNMQVWFCLNCDEWIQDKTQVLNKGWSFFYQKGDLRRDV